MKIPLALFACLAGSLTYANGLIDEDRPGALRKGDWEVGLSVGAGFNMKVLESRYDHDWGIGILEGGYVLSDMVAENHWWRGNWELLGQVMGGWQFYPDEAYVFGIAPVIRYNVNTGSRWVPFIDFGAGVAATEIRDDLSTTFQFNLQAGVGTRYFLTKDMALVLQYRWIHLSNAGIEFPNTGVNSSTFLLGASWLF